MEIPQDVNQMSQEELLFHYFKMLDVDKNTKLDGTELVASIIHYSSIKNSQWSRSLFQSLGHSHENDADGHSHPEMFGKIFSDEELEQQIDPVLKKDDLNKDGYIDYPEFILAQQKTDVKLSVSWNRDRHRMIKIETLFVMDWCEAGLCN